MPQRVPAPPRPRATGRPSRKGTGKNASIARKTKADARRRPGGERHEATVGLCESARARPSSRAPSRAEVTRPSSASTLRYSLCGERNTSDSSARVRPSSAYGTKACSKFPAPTPRGRSRTRRRVSDQAASLTCTLCRLWRWCQQTAGARPRREGSARRRRAARPPPPREPAWPSDRRAVGTSRRRPAREGPSGLPANKDREGPRRRRRRGPRLSPRTAGIRPRFRRRQQDHQGQRHELGGHVDVAEACGHLVSRREPGQGAETRELQQAQSRDRGAGDGHGGTKRADLRGPFAGSRRRKRGPRARSRHGRAGAPSPRRAPDEGSPRQRGRRARKGRGRRAARKTATSAGGATPPRTRRAPAPRARTT